MFTSDPNARPAIPPWPNRREAPTEVELDEVHSFFGATEADCPLLFDLLQGEIEAALLIEGTLAALDVATGRVVDLYHRVPRDKELTPDTVRPYAKAILNTLLKMQGAESASFEMPARGASDPKGAEVKTPEDIAFQLVKGAAVTSKFANTYLTDVGLAAQIDFPPHFGQPARD